jgi:3-deoxy-D-manno-octulosonic-acid transferase
LEKLGVTQKRISVTGDCKIDSLLKRKSECGAMRTIHHTKPIFIAGSTHPGEEQPVIAAFKILREKVPEARLIIVPRHPERAGDIGALISHISKTAYYSEFSSHEFLNDGNTWESIIVDRIGALFCLYSIAEGAFIGGSLVSKGGQNIMEPALFGTPFCHGKYMSDFSHVSDQFRDLGISKIVATAEEIADFWLQSMDESFKRKTVSLCDDWFNENGGAAAKNWDIIKNYI